jgi:hypothetical protein
VTDVKVTANDIYAADQLDCIGGDLTPVGVHCLSIEALTDDYSASVQDGVEAHVASKALKTEKLVRDTTGEFRKVPIPKTLRDVMQSPDKEAWLQAMQNEIDSHKRSKTWELVRAATIQAGRRAVGSTWAFDVKRNADGTIARYKARLCAQGFSQIEGWDYHHTYSNTVRLENSSHPPLLCCT